MSATETSVYTLSELGTSQQLHNTSLNLLIIVRFSGLSQQTPQILKLNGHEILQVSIQICQSIAICQWVMMTLKLRSLPMDTVVRTLSIMHNLILNIWEERLINVGDSSMEYQWYSGQILNYDPVSGKYGAFFPSDGQSLLTPLRKQTTLTTIVCIAELNKSWSPCIHR